MALNFDVRTILVIYLAFAIIDACVAAIVWFQNQNLRGVPEIAAAYILGGIGLAIQSIAATTFSPFALLAANLLVNLSHGLGVNGFGNFLGRPNRMWLPVSCVIFTILVWPPALYFAPQDRAPRIVAVTIVTLLTFGYFLFLIVDGHPVHRWVRRIMGALTAGHIGFSVARAWWALEGLPSRIDANAPLDVWSALESVVYANTLFVGFLVMVGARLNDDLRTRNRILSDEISQRLRLERQLSSALAIEVRLRTEQQQLIHIVGHEIRSPLAGIDRAAEMLLLGDTAILHRVDRIRTQVRHTIGLIDRLLASERDRHALLRPEPLVVDEVIGIVVRGFEDVGTSHRIHVTTLDRPARIVADQGMVMAILRNLIENAMKYSPPDTTVTITVSHRVDEVDILVYDRGIGIPHAERDLIGRRFYRASNVGTIAGTGLGIFAVRRLLAAQGGRLTIDDGPDGEGTTMIATLPLTCRSNVPEPVDA